MRLCFPYPAVLSLKISFLSLMPFHFSCLYFPQKCLSFSHVFLFLRSLARSLDRLMCLHSSLSATLPGGQAEQGKTKAAARYRVCLPIMRQRLSQNTRGLLCVLQMMVCAPVMYLYTCAYPYANCSRELLTRTAHASLPCAETETKESCCTSTCARENYCRMLQLSAAEREKESKG